MEVNSQGPKEVYSRVRKFWEEKGVIVSPALAQWFSLIPYLGGFGFVMLEGKVDDEWHSLIINPNYENFCVTVLGTKVTHSPDFKGIDNDLFYTLRLLEKSWGEELDDTLKEWREEYLYGIYTVFMVFVAVLSDECGLA